MKNKTISLSTLLMGTLLAACSSGEITPNDNGQETQVELKFYVDNYEQIDLEGLTRTESVSSLNFLAFAVYDTETNEVIISPTIQSSSDDGYGEFSATLAYGTYRIVFLGYDSTKELYMDDPTAIYWADNAVTNTFCESFELTVDESTAVTQNIVLSRVVGLFRMVSEGENPSNFSAITINMQGGSYLFNAITETASGTDLQRTYTYSYSSSAGKSGFALYTYAFLPTGETTATINVQAKDSDGNIIHQRTFTDVPMKVNLMTTYTGSFFSEDTSQQSFNLSLETQTWETQDETF